MDSSTLRSRQPPPRPQQPQPPASRPSSHAFSSIGISVLDIVRVLGGVALLSGTLSYLVTGQQSVMWGYNVRPARLKAWVRPVSLTPTQLLVYDGRDHPSVPIYVALNGTIYDVSASPHLYGPGGSYHFFAGRDATRAFVTGCFEEDLTGDLRGVERMFMPVDDDEEGEGGGGEGYKEDGGRERRRARKLRREKEVREAKRKVWEAVDGWRKMFDGGKGGKYFRVGKVVGREEGWGEEIPRLCNKAEKARPQRGVKK